MAVVSGDARTGVTQAQCGCCGSSRPAARLVELGNTPGVFICDGCALWAARRSSRAPVVRLDPRVLVGWLRRRVRTSAAPSGKVIPILPSSDLERTAEFYRALGMQEAERYEGHLLMHIGGMEVHFSRAEDASAGGQALVIVPDAGRLWKQLRSRHVAGVGPVEDLPHGLREFVVTDPDGNRIRVASPVPD